MMTAYQEVSNGRELLTKAYLDSGVVTWPGNIDIAPDAMYREIKQHGQWVLR